MSQGRARLLVAEDDLVNQKMLCTYLQKSGYDVEAVASGSDVMARLQAGERYDLLLLDDMMPGLSGLETLQALRRDPEHGTLPVIMATAKSETADIVRALELGADDYVTKPFDFPVLLARVAARLRADRAVSQAPREAPDSREVGPGMLLGGKYLLEEAVGEGSYGSVWRARHVGLDTAVAVKVLHLDRSGSADSLERFRREGVSACRISHPNAVRVIDYDVTDNGVAFLVMELLEGRSLQDEMDEEGALRPARCVEVLMPVCYVLANAHQQGIVHRDIKPANIFLHRLPGREVVKVLDFGIAKFVGDHGDLEKLTGDRILGSPAYMAPERVARQPYDGQIDVYALGVMLFEMLTGELPFGGPGDDPVQVAVAHLKEDPPSVLDLRPDVPPAVAEIVADALHKDPRARPRIDRMAIRLVEAALQSA